MEIRVAENMDFQLIAILVATFFAAGVVKGMVGLGLPTVSLALLCVTMDIFSAMALLLAPSLITNLWQMFGSSSPLGLFKKLWPLYCSSTISVAFGVFGFTFLDAEFAEQLLGFLLVVYAVLSIFGLRFVLQEKQISFVGGLAGFLTGVLTGLTGSFVVPSIMFLQATRLSVAEFAQATGLLFSLLTLSLGLSLFIAGRLSTDITFFSLAGIAPAFVGMFIGYQIRAKLKGEMFRLMLNFGLLIIGFELLLTPFII